MLKCTKNDSVWGSVPALGNGAPRLAGFSHTVYRVLVMSGKGFIYSTKCFLFILKCSKISLLVYEARSASDPAGKA